MQLPQKAPGLLFIAAQQIGRGGCIADLESGLVVEQQVCPVLADMFRHPQGSQTPGNDAAVRGVLLLVVDVGNIALPPLPPDFNVAVIIRIQLQMFGFVQIDNNKSFIGKVANDLFRSMNLAQSGLNLDTDDLKQAGNLGLCI